MEATLVELLEAWGYLALVAVGFAEFSGAPIASVPVLLVAGALGSSAGLGMVPTIVSAAAGGLVADVGWFALVRWRGDGVVDAACGLTSNPDACVTVVGERVRRVGPAYVIPSKFVPGAGNLVAAGAALAGMAPARFVAFDSLALLLWAGGWTAVGRVFSGELRAVLQVVARYQRWGLALAVALVLAAAVWRGARVRRHRRGHD